MNKIRERILNNVTEYDNGAYKDLIAFYICAEYLTTAEDENLGIDADFNEIIVVVEKQWLFTKMKKEGIKNPLKYLEEEYTSDDSIEWYTDALLENKLVAISFS